MVNGETVNLDEFLDIWDTISTEGANMHPRHFRIHNIALSLDDILEWQQDLIHYLNQIRYILQTTEYDREWIQILQNIGDEAQHAYATAGEQLLHYARNGGELPSRACARAERLHLTVNQWSSNMELYIDLN